MTRSSDLGLVIFLSLFPVVNSYLYTIILVDNVKQKYSAVKWHCSQLDFIQGTMFVFLIKPNNLDGHDTDVSEAGEMWHTNAATWAHKIKLRWLTPWHTPTTRNCSSTRLFHQRRTLRYICDLTLQTTSQRWWSLAKHNRTRDHTSVSWWKVKSKHGPSLSVRLFVQTFDIDFYFKKKTKFLYNNFLCPVKCT